MMTHLRAARTAHTAHTHTHVHTSVDANCIDLQLQAAAATTITISNRKSLKNHTIHPHNTENRSTITIAHPNARATPIKKVTFLVQRRAANKRAATEILV